jgi:hypothetical protein
MQIAGANGWPKARDVVCFSAKGVPHGEGHNRVCVCGCQWCRAERAQAPALPEAAPAQGDLFGGDTAS